MPLVLGNALTPRQRATIVAAYGEQPDTWFKLRVFSFSRQGRLLSIVELKPADIEERLA